MHGKPDQRGDEGCCRWDNELISNRLLQFSHSGRGWQTLPVSQARHSRESRNSKASLVVVVRVGDWLPACVRLTGEGEADGNAPVALVRQTGGSCCRHKQPCAPRRTSPAGIHADCCCLDAERFMMHDRCSQGWSIRRRALCCRAKLLVLRPRRCWRMRRTETEPGPGKPRL